MIFWHLGGAVFLFRLAFKDSDADLRFLAFGALPARRHRMGGRLVGSRAPAGLIGHSVAFCLGLLVAALVLTSRRSRGRKQAVVVVVGAIMHLVLDLGWIEPQLLLWPMLGYELPAGIESDWSGLARLSSADLLPIGQEIVGIAYLAWLARKARLGDPLNRARLWRSGRSAPSGLAAEPALHLRLSLGSAAASGSATSRSASAPARSGRRGLGSVMFSVEIGSRIVTVMCPGRMILDPGPQALAAARDRGGTMGTPRLRAMAKAPFLNGTSHRRVIGVPSG